MPSRSLVVAFTALLAASCGGKLKLVATAPAEGEVRPTAAGRVFKSARFAPDGSYIAFHAVDSPGKDIVGVMRPDGNEERELATGTALTSVAWSPDGKTIYFTSGTGIAAVDPASGTQTKVTDAADATDLDVSADGAVLLWVKNGATVQSLHRNVAGAVPKDETHRGSVPRFDGNGAVYGYVYVGVDGANHPLQRDILGTIGPSGGVTLDLGPLASVSALGTEEYVVTSQVGVERVSQAGMRTVLRTVASASRVDATPDGKWILYLVAESPSLFVMASP